jgi:hypothetical protein
VLAKNVTKNMSGNIAQIEVVLRDFDGTRTIFNTDLPLRDILHTGQTDMDVIVNKTYRRTTEQDEQGRPAYVELR